MRKSFRVERVCVYIALGWIQRETISTADLWSVSTTLVPSPISGSTDRSVR
jgi:hypothetical protein